MNAELTEAETYLSEVATRANLDHVPTETVALSGSTASTLLDVAHSSQADLNLVMTWSVAVDTDVASAIIRLAENGEDAQGAGVFGGCDVIAMATHEYSGLQRWAMGSITQRVLGATGLPLLVVRPPEMMDQSYVH